MILIVIAKDTCQIHEVSQYLSTEDCIERVWSPTWPGEHIIGKDCDWLKISEKEWTRVKFIRDNPDLTIEEIKKQLKISYSRVYQLAQCYKLPVKRERAEREKSNWKKHFTKDKGCF